MNKMIFGKTRAEWSNIWLYGKVKYLIIIVAVAFVGYMVYTIATNTPADFKIAAVGEFSVQEGKITENYAKSLFPAFQKVEIASAYLSESGGAAAEYGAANAQKAMILLTVSGEDLVVVDRATFDRYAPMGAFKPIGDLYKAVSVLDETKDLALQSVEATIAVDSGETGTTDIYGISLKNSQLLNSIGIYGRDQILTISIKTEREVLTRDFITKLLKDGSRLLPSVTMIPSPSPSPVPTPTLAASSTR